MLEQETVRVFDDDWWEESDFAARVRHLAIQSMAEKIDRLFTTLAPDEKAGPREAAELEADEGTPTAPTS